MKENFGFFKRVDEGWNVTVKVLESWRLERLTFVSVVVARRNEWGRSAAAEQ